MAVSRDGLTESVAPAADNVYLFEISWEVLNKVGGISTVIRSKADITVQEYGERYFLVGPFNAAQCRTEFEACDLDETIGIQEVLSTLRTHGVKVRTGRWKIGGHPYVILFEISSAAHRLKEWRADFFEVTKIKIPWSDTEVNDALIFGYLTAWFMGELRLQPSFRKSKAILQFHEWLSSIGLLLCRQRGFEMATVFTTHATLLGRYLSAGNVSEQQSLRQVDCDREAANRGFYYRYCIEKVAASVCHIFTAVSKTTAEESRKFLRRYPDIITPNGMNGNSVTPTGKLQEQHRTAKEKIHDFVRGHFHGHLSFDLENTLYLFLAGRYEFHNKGCDHYIEALARLNHRLKKEGTDINIVAFIIMPAATNGYNASTLRGQFVRQQLQKAVASVPAAYFPALMNSSLRGSKILFENLPDGLETEHLKNCVENVKPCSFPPICTHNMLDDKTDPVLMEIRRCRLFNHPSDRVKVIFHPQFLSPTSSVLPMEYDEFVHGCHLGVFPSSYEPWGYTPAECAVIGVPSITTNLSGFGCFIEELIPIPADFGIFLVDRKYKSAEQAIEQLTGYIHNFAKLSGSERRLQRRKTELLRNVLDWKTLGYAYTKARNMALQMLPQVLPSSSRPSSASSKASSRPSTGRSSRSGASRPSSAKGKPVKAYH